MTDAHAETIREAVGVLDDAGALERTIDELEENGFDRTAVSLLASDSTVREKLGRHYRDVRQLEDAPDAPREVYVAAEEIGNAKGALIGGLTYVGALAAAGGIVASGGALATALLAGVAAGGTGAAIGSVLAGLVGQQHAEHFDRQLERGGILLWVRTPDKDSEKRAMDILTRAGARDVHVHELPA